VYGKLFLRLVVSGESFGHAGEGTLELLTGVNKVPFLNKEAPLRIRSAASRRGH